MTSLTTMPKKSASAEIPKKVINIDYLLSRVAAGFKKEGLKVCKYSRALISDDYDELELSKGESVYYQEYAEAIVGYLSHTYRKVDLSDFRLNKDRKGVKTHDFVLSNSDDLSIPVSLQYKTLGINDLIPSRLMKICKLRGGTKPNRKYTEGYEAIETRAYSKISHYERFKDVPEEKLDAHLITPMRDLVVETLDKKKTLSANLYHYLMTDKDRLLFRLRKKGFDVYDFTRDIPDPTAHKIEVGRTDLNSFLISFNNECSFQLELRPNNPYIKEHISLKFRVSFENLDDTFMARTVELDF